MKMLRYIFAILCFATTVFYSSSPVKADDNIRLSAMYQAIYAENLIRSINISLLGIVDIFSQQGVNEIDELIIHETLNRYIDRVPGLRAVIVTDINGILQYDSFRYPAIKSNLKKRDYIRNAFALDLNELHISPPLKSEFVNFASLPLSKPIKASDGNIVGVVAGIMIPDHLLRHNRICKKCMVSIFKTSGEQLVTFPAQTTHSHNIRKIIAEHSANQNFSYKINGLETETLWIKMKEFGLVLLFSKYK